MSLLTVDNLKVHFHTRRGIIRAVDGISYSLEPGEILGVVGESGSGKSVSCYSLLDLLPKPPARIENGTALFDGIDLLNCKKSLLQKIRGKEIAMIFQDPMTSLNPYLTIGKQLTEPLLIHALCSQKEAIRRCLKALDEVGINQPDKRFRQYPHELSGGMKQRVMIAMALVVEPKLLIADEPTTALDVTVQAQILELIRQLQKKVGMSVIFITHNLGVVAGLADKILVMYAGKVVEEGKTRGIFYKPSHPYTRALLASLPSVHQPGEALYTISGMPPDLSVKQMGCSFSPRCEFAKDNCFTQIPDLLETSSLHKTACMRIQNREIS